MPDSFTVILVDAISRKFYNLHSDFRLSLFGFLHPVFLRIISRFDRAYFRQKMKRFFIADDDTSGMYAELGMKEFSDVSNQPEHFSPGVA